MSLAIRPVLTAADRKAFVNIAYTLNHGDPNWVPPLRSEMLGLITPGSNPWFEHAEAALFIAERDDGEGARPVGRISAQVDALVLEHMGAGTGQWGMFEAEDGTVAAALLAVAEAWLRKRGMERALGPFSLSIWDEPGLLVEGHDHPPTVMMGHNRPEYRLWIEGAGHKGVKDLYTYRLDLARPFPPIVGRIVAAGESNPRIRLRHLDRRRFARETGIVLDLVNDAWADNWGFVPLTDAEIAYGGRKLKPIVFEDLVRIAELDGEPAAFMMALPDVNLLIRDLGGRLFPFGWAKLLWRLRRRRFAGVRVPLMGVRKDLRGSRLAIQLALMLVDRIRRAGRARYKATTEAEFGWVLEDNLPMRGIADAIGAERNRVYRIYEKSL